MKPSGTILEMPVAAVRLLRRRRPLTALQNQARGFGSTNAITATVCRTGREFEIQLGFADHSSHALRYPEPRRELGPSTPRPPIDRTHIRLPRAVRPSRTQISRTAPHWGRSAKRSRQARCEIFITRSASRSAAVSCEPTCLPVTCTSRQIAASTACRYADRSSSGVTGCSSNVTSAKRTSSGGSQLN